MPSPIVFENDDWLVVDKPTDIATYATKYGDQGVQDWLVLHQDRQIYVCSRLDKGTSGVLLFAKTKTASGEAQRVHEQDLATKTYTFISRKRYEACTVGETTWHVTLPLAGKECSTEFSLVGEGNGYYHYQATIKRGRNHQIRQHASLSGIPILGDTTYGGASFPRLCLHCGLLEWPTVPKIEIPPPDSFSLLVAGADKIVIDGAIAWERRGRWPQFISNSWRLIQRGELELPVSIDIYDTFLSITGFSDSIDSLGLKERLQPLLDYYAGKVSIRGGLLRQHAQNPHQKKLIHDLVSWGETVTETILAEEHDLTYQVNLNDSQHVGLFLDQRDSRKRVLEAAQSRRVANLFSFTCSFSAAAVQGGAEVVFSVDLAGSTLGRGKENFAINGLDESGRGKFIKEDVCKWLARQERKKNANPEDFAFWDLVICDPPVFASAGKGRSFHVEKEWPELTRQIRAILSPTGIALFANNHRSGNASFYLNELEKHFSIVTQLSPPLDFPRLPGQPEHVRIYWCQV